MLLVLGNLKVLRDENAITKVCGKDGRGLQAEEPVKGLWGQSQRVMLKG